MNRQKFLKQLEALWKHDKTSGYDLCLEDLLDDAATIGLPGAAKLYVSLLLKAGIDKSTN